MRFVPSPAQSPQRCAFLPTIAGFHPKGFIEGTEMPGGTRAYISVEAVQQIAKAMDWVPQARYAAEDARVDRLTAEAERKDARIADLEAQLEAVEVLRRGGFQSARKPGRPKKEAVA